MGSTSFPICIRSLIWDHPHIHGEHSVQYDRKQHSTGSPPYTWGALASDRLVFWSERITPIYMGSTLLVANRQPCLQDHPHIHGEHLEVLELGEAHIGSPPYTWGALLGLPL